MEGTRVRRLREQDIDLAIALTDLENWGYSAADFRRLLALSPDGCFAAEADGRVVGVLTTTTYNGLAFLGAVIVSPDLRGKGIGKRMMEAALEHLRTTGVRTVRLNAYLTAVRFYEALGFHGEYELIRWHGAASEGRFRGVRPVRVEDLDRLAWMDSMYFGASRRSLLERLADELPTTFLVAERGGKLRGFIVGSPDADACEIGPWTVEPGLGAVVRDLFHGLIAAVGTSEIALSGPSANEPLLEFVREARFAEVFRSLRMWWGSEEFHGTPAGIWAVGGLEKG